MDEKIVPKNILLVSPTDRKEMAEVKWLVPPLGIARLAGFLNNNGHKAEYLDTNFYLAKGRDNYFEEKLKEKRWDIIGFSLLDETLLNDIQNIYLAKKICPDAILVAGGLEAQFNYQTILDKTPCKIAILGEGEMPLSALARGESLEKIPGIVFRNDAKPFDECLFWQATRLIDWENIPFEDYWDFYMKKYEGQLTDERMEQIHTLRIFTHNRCPNKCKFCSSTNQLTWAAGKDTVPVVDVIADEDKLVKLIEVIKAAHPRLRTIYFTDDNFAFYPDTVIKFCQNIQKKNLGLSFICLARMDRLSEEVVSCMAKANFRVINMGVESFSQGVLDEYNRGYKTEIADEKIKLLQKYGIHPFLSIILISPNSTLDDLEITVDKTFEYVKDGLATASIALACIPLKGSVFHEEYFDYMTEVADIPGTSHKIKREINILANDPYAREAQLAFYRGVSQEVQKRIKEMNIPHATAANQAKIRLEFMKKIIGDIRQKYNIKFGETPNQRTEKSELMASQALVGVEKDKYQGI